VVGQTINVVCRLRPKKWGVA